MSSDIKVIGISPINLMLSFPILIYIFSNFIIGVKNSTIQESPQPIWEAFPFRFSDQIHLIDWIDFKHYEECQDNKNLQEIMKSSMENTMQKLVVLLLLK